MYQIVPIQITSTREWLTTASAWVNISLYNLQVWLEGTHMIQIPPLVLWGWWCYDKGGGQTTQPLCSVTGHKLVPLIANRCGVILIVLVCQRRIWGSSPHFVSVPTSKLAGRWNGWAAFGPCRGGLFTWSFPWASWLHIAVCSSFMGMCSL